MNQSQNVLKMSNTSRETATPLIDGFAVHGPVQLYDISAVLRSQDAFVVQ